jgi:DNA repair exonuclease SbcCD ATPase subunit
LLELNSDVNRLHAEIKQINSNLRKMGEESIPKLQSGISQILFILLLALLVLGVRYAYNIFKGRPSLGARISDISEQIDNLSDQLFKHFGTKPSSNTSAQREIEAKLRAKEDEIKAKRKENEDMVTTLAQSKDAIRGLEQLASRSESELTNARNERRALKAELERVIAELGTLRADLSGQQVKLNALKSALVPAVPGSLGSALGDELIESLQQKSLHAVSLLGCLGMVKAAEGSAMEEEVLLSTLRQFSESLVSFRTEQGKLPDSVQKELVTWADAFNVQFNGRLDIRVPALGFPVDARTMTPLRGATKVSAVLSWSIYNSKGSVFAPAKVS